MNVEELTTIIIVAKVAGNDVNIEFKKINGNVPNAITRKRLIGILATSIVGVAMLPEDDGMQDHELITLAVKRIGDAFADTDSEFYRVPKETALEGPKS